MDKREIDELANILREQFSIRKLKISKAAAFQEAQFILPIIYGIRCSCLFSVIPTTNDAIQAVLEVIKRIDQSENVNVVVHLPSKQTFIVNRNLFVQRMKKDIYVNQLYYSINVEQAEARAMPPDYLKGMLQAINEFMNAQQHQLIILRGENLLSESGICLAGWLLEYCVIYYYNLSQCDVEAVLSNELDDHDDDVSDIGNNNLQGKELIIVFIDLIANSNSITLPLLQFTVPLNFISNQHLNKLCERSINAFEERLRQLQLQFKVSLHSRSGASNAIAI